MIGREALGPWRCDEPSRPRILAARVVPARKLRGLEHLGPRTFGDEGPRQAPNARTALLCAGSSFFHDPAAVILRAD